MVEAGPIDIQRKQLEAFGLMRTGALLLIIGSVITGIGLMFFLMSFFAIVPGRGGPFGEGVERAFIGLLALFAGMAVLLLAGAVISLVGVYTKFVPGTTRLAEVDPRYRTASTLIRVGYVGGLIALIAGVFLLLIPVIGWVLGVVAIIVGLILMFIGNIGVIVLCFNLSDAEKITLYLVAGILFIIGIFVYIANFIGWILLYIALGDSVKRRATTMATQPTIISL